MSDWWKALERQRIDLSTLHRLEEAEDPIFILTTHGAEAMRLWRRLRTLVDECGHWPVLLGSTEDLESHVENLEEAGYGSTQLLLRTAERLDPRVWLREQGGNVAEPVGPWPTRVSNDPGGDDAFSIPTDLLTRKPLRAVHLALVPTRKGWEVPAYLRFGG